MIVIINPEAEADLERIGDTIAKDNPIRALTFVSELRQWCDTLALAPRRFPLVPRYENTGVRRAVRGNNLIYEAILSPEG